MDKKKVAIIGAGLAGLVTIKSCLEEGMEVVVFEQSDRLGGNWQFKKGAASVFRHNELTSSKYLTAFSDFPMPEDFPHFLKHEQYLDYLLLMGAGFLITDFSKMFFVMLWLSFGVVKLWIDRARRKSLTPIANFQGRDGIAVILM